MKKMLVLIVILFIAGCNEDEKPSNIKPIEQQLIPLDPNWAIAYGDSEQSHLTYAVAINRHNQLQIVKIINQHHPKPDPNEVTLLQRIEALEKAAIPDVNAALLIDRVEKLEEFNIKTKSSLIEAAERDILLAKVLMEMPIDEAE